MQADKRYLIFKCEYYESAGGLHDLHKSLDTVQEVAEFLSEEKGKKESIDYSYHVYDRLAGFIVYDDAGTLDVYKKEG